MKKILVIGMLGALALLSACSTIPRPGPVGNSAVPEPARSVDLTRYMGKWYEQYRYEASFQKDMDYVSADYSVNENGSVRVVNTGRKGGANGKLKTAVAKAKVVDTATNAKLKVSFFGPFYGDYWVLDRGDNYEWSVVGEPSGRYLWILTRDANPSQEALEALVGRVKSLGYDTQMLRRTQQEN